MAKAFISHSSNDKEFVEKIVRQLGRNQCHYDSLTFEAGEKALEEIFRSLEDTDVFVLFISEAALESKWVKKEISHVRKLADRNIIDRIFPIIIDRSVSHSDSRIPSWIRKPYNIKQFDNEVIVLKKIKQILREADLKQYSHLRDLDELFFGRNDIMQEFEKKMVNLEGTKPTCIIASSYFEGMGRRTFLRNGLIKTRIIDKLYEPIPISISSKESIEDFIYKLNFVEITPDIFKYDFTEESIETKVQIARDYVKQFVDSGEILFIIDEGSIVLPNHTIVDWFKDIIIDPRLKNQVSICLISKFKAYYPHIKKIGNILNFQINELSTEDTQTFFLQYLQINGSKMNSDDSRFFLKYLKGIPGQIIYAANLIQAMGVAEAKTYINDIEEFDELRALSILDYLKNDELSTQILIALARFEIISHDLVYRIFGDSQAVTKSIQKLFDLTLFFSISSTHDYLKLNSSVADYINRAKLDLDGVYQESIKKLAKEAIEKPLDLNENSDYSEFLFNLQNMIRENIAIPKKFLIPSFILKSIIQEYNDRHYKKVIELASKLLENDSKFDPQILRETRIWLCLAFCREQDERFFQTVNSFDNGDHESLKDYFFLLGFYYRHGDDMENAERNFLEVLKIDDQHSRTKRELVNVYLRQGEYMKALKWAKDNYNRFKTNILHIQAYFTCLIKKTTMDHTDIEILNELINNASKSLDKKATQIKNEMQAEYDYYIDGDHDKAIQILNESLKLNNNDYYAFRALIEIYREKNNLLEINNLIARYPHLAENEIP